MMEISVVIPTYNRKDALARLIDSVYAAGFDAGRHEVIVIDDGSCDGTDRLLNEAAKTRPNFSFKSVKNAGPGQARNTGAGLSRGRIIAFLDDDCVVDGNWLSEVNRSFAPPQDSPDLCTEKYPAPYA